MDPRFDIERLLAFGLDNGFIGELDVPMARNALLDIFKIDKPYDSPAGAGPRTHPSGSHIHPASDSALLILKNLLDYAAEQEIIEHDNLTERDLFDTRLMGSLMPRPSEVARRFESIESESGIRAACDWFYEFCIKSVYIRAERIAKNIGWAHESKYGALEITINLSKPEKDPQEVARLRTLPQIDYPKCMLCEENVGYAGRLDYPARQTLRVIPMALNGEQWYFQFSPYVYYNQHCIVLREEPQPDEDRAGDVRAAARIRGARAALLHGLQRRAADRRRIDTEPRPFPGRRSWKCPWRKPLRPSGSGRAAGRGCPRRSYAGRCPCCA